MPVGAEEVVQELAGLSRSVLDGFSKCKCCLAFILMTLHSRTVDIPACTLELVRGFSATTQCVKRKCKGFKRGLGRRKLLELEQADETRSVPFVPAPVEVGLLMRSCRLGADGVEYFTCDSYADS